MIHRLDNAGVAVTDLDLALAFYERLGFEVSNRESDTPSATLIAGQVKLWIFQTAGGPAAPRSPDLVGTPAGFDHLSFWVGDVDRAVVDMKAHGLELEMEPADQDWGFRAASALDPDGNRIFLLGPLKAVP